MLSENHHVIVVKILSAPAKALKAIHRINTRSLKVNTAVMSLTAEF